MGDRKLKTFCELIFEALQDFTLILLLISGTVQLILGYTPQTASSCDVYPSSHAWVEPFAIYMAVVVVCLVAAGTDYGKQLQMKEQQAKKNKMSKYQVQRDGKTVTCQKTELCVGDIVDLAIGDIVPADAYFLKGKSFQLDESSLTGEPHLMNKTVAKPWLLSGTQVKNGAGTVMIIAVGPNSISGEITMKDNMLKAIVEYANQGKRTLALAYRDFAKDVDLKEEWVDPAADAAVATTKNDDKVIDYAVEHDLCLISIVGIADPLRDGVKEAIQKCFTAGV